MSRREGGGQSHAVLLGEQSLAGGRGNTTRGKGAAIPGVDDDVVVGVKCVDGDAAFESRAVV